MRRGRSVEPALARAIEGALALVQAGGIALPALRHSPAAALLGAALFGGTFMGITTLAMAAARGLAPASPGRIIGTLTAVYGRGRSSAPYWPASPPAGSEIRARSSVTAAGR